MFSFLFKMFSQKGLRITHSISNSFSVMCCMYLVHGLTTTSSRFFFQPLYLVSFECAHLFDRKNSMIIAYLMCEQKKEWKENSGKLYLSRLSASSETMTRGSFNIANSITLEEFVWGVVMRKLNELSVRRTIFGMNVKGGGSCV